MMKEQHYSNEIKSIDYRHHYMTVCHNPPLRHVGYGA